MSTQKREHGKMFVGRSDDKIKSSAAVAVKTNGENYADLSNVQKHGIYFKKT